MFFFALQNGQIINLDQIVAITVSNPTAQLVMSTGKIVYLNTDEWEQIQVVIESYIYRDELK